MDIKFKISQHPITNKVLPHARNDEFFKTKPKLSQILLNLKTLIKTREFNFNEAIGVALFSSQRSGSNLFGSIFHYQKEIFSVSEQERRFQKKYIHYRFFLLRSIYGSLGLQQKKPKDIKVLIFNKISLDDDNWKPKIVNESSNKKSIYYIRNPLHTIISLNNASISLEKKDWGFSVKTSKETINKVFKNAIQGCLQNEKYPDKHLVVLHEEFCSKIDEECNRVINFIDPSIKPTFNNSNNNALEFFLRLYCCNTTPIIKKEYLSCPKCFRKVVGYGDFNPLKKVSLKRTTPRRNRDAVFNDTILDYLKVKFGEDIALDWIHNRNIDHLTFKKRLCKHYHKTNTQQ